MMNNNSIHTHTQKYSDEPPYHLFYDMIGYEPYQELRIFFPSGAIKSEYATNYEEVRQILEKYKGNNIYVGTNPRKNKGRKGIDVAYRRTIIFDVEMEGEKQPLTNNKYQTLLNQSVQTIIDYMKINFKFEYSFIVISGRGMHVYYTIKPLKGKQLLYNKFYSKIITAINLILPKGMKSDVMVKDEPRILGAPGTHNTKYPEKTAFRRIVKYQDKINDLEPILDKVKIFRKKVVENYDGKLNVKTIQNKPEFKIFTYNKHSTLPKGGVNNKLRLALKLLMRNSNFKYEDAEYIAGLITEFNLPYKNMYMEGYEDYTYSENILNNWVLENYDWCVKNNFKLPYKLKYKSDPNATISKKIFEWNNKKLETFNEVIDYVVNFNKEFVEDYDDFSVYYDNALYYNLKNNCDKLLLEFIDSNNLFKKIKHIRSISTYKELNDIMEWVVK